MSVIVYGPGGTKLIDPYDLHAYLNNGWNLSPPTSQSMEEVTDETTIEVNEEPNKLIKSLNLDALSDDEIRVMAKDLKIPNWYNKRIDRLKGEIRAT